MNPGRRRPVVGFFDSGVGGLSVWNAVVRRLPYLSTLYVADSAHCPYGSRPAEQIRRFARGIAYFLLERGANLIVVACNTASAAALTALRAEFPVPVVGMEPAVKPAAAQTRTGHIGVLATQGTVHGDLFRTTSARYSAGVAVHVQVGEGLVERIEAGQADQPETEVLLRSYLQPMLSAQVDQIVLGCTHFPLLLPVIRRIVPSHVTVIDPAEAVARQVQRVLLAEQPLTGEWDGYPGPADAHFFSSGRLDILAGLVHTLAGQLPRVDRVTWREDRLVSDSVNG
jgi:glutamate racemase